MELEKALSKIPIIQEIDNLKRQVDELRPFSDEAQNRIMQKFRLEWNYHSNAIEGNPYTYGETVAFIMHGITAKGKKLKDHLDIKGHDETIQYLLEMVRGERNFTENDIRELHKMILKEPYSTNAITPTGQQVQKQIKLGEYKSMPNHVKTKTGEIHYYATPEETPLKMADLMKWYSEAYENKEIHPLVVASLFHHKFVSIHPFDDGNGRLGRILMNFILMRKSLPPIVVRQEDRENYYAVLSQADVGENLPLVEYLGEELKRSLDIQLRGAKGEDISELADLDKEIALLKGSFDESDRIKEKKSNKIIKEVMVNMHPVIFKTYRRCTELSGLFFESKYKVEFDTNSGSSFVPQFYMFSSPDSILSKDEMKENIKSFRFDFQFNGFKKSEKPFNLHANFTVDFGKYKYTINERKGDEKIKFEKFYDEFLTDEEIEQLVYNTIKIDVLDPIKSNTKNK